LSKKDNRPWAILQVEDLDGSVEVLVYADAFQKAQSCIGPEKPVLVCGRVDSREDKPKLIAGDIYPLDEAAERFTKSVHLHIPNTRFSVEHLEQVRDLLHRYPGRLPVLLCLEQANGEVVYVQPSQDFHIKPDQHLLHELRHVMGEQSVFLKVAVPTPERNGRKNGKWSK
jgi:DNA polymerase III subunit alpha